MSSTHMRAWAARIAAPLRAVPLARSAQMGLRPGIATSGLRGRRSTPCRSAVVLNQGAAGEGLVGTDGAVDDAEAVGFHVEGIAVADVSRDR